ncbi:MAG: LysE family translocator [Pseudomonadota bacterium]
MIEVLSGAVPDAEILLGYTVACAILFLTPGPDMSLFLAKTLSGGRSAGIAAMAGAVTGCLVHTTLAAVGLSAVLAASPDAFFVLKVVGALYLLWLAIDAIRNGAILTVGETSRATSFWASYATGIGINLTNPKIVLFFVTFLPQFVSAADPNASAKLVFFGLYFIAFSIPLATLLIFAADRFIQFVKEQPRVLRALDYSFAGVFGYFAFKILTVDPQR